MLYYTLNSNLKKEDLKKSQKKELIEFIKKINSKKTDENYQIKKAVILLITEHYSATGNEFDLACIKLPYDLEQSEDSVKIDIDLLPIPLRWILYKFLYMKVKNAS